ncbi:MAG: nucleotidyltransferase [Nitrospirota bacterium]
MRIKRKSISIKELAAIVSNKLNESGIDAILVGGACVSIYTKNKYLSSDIDFVSAASIKEISPVLLDLGFERKSSRHFEKKDCPFFIEFVSPPAALGSEPVKETNVLKTRLGDIILLTPTDSVKDRLAAYYHWNDPQALEQAMLIARSQKISLREVKRWSEKEGQKVKYNFFLKAMKRSK